MRRLTAASALIAVASVVLAFVARGSDASSPGPRRVIPDLGLATGVAVSSVATAERSESGWKTIVLGDVGSDAFALNDHGRVVGSYETEAWVWENGRLRNLPGLRGYLWSSARAINEHGQIVGRALSEDEEHVRAVVWEDGTVRAIMRREASARSIDDRGRIVGRAYVGGTSRAFLWSNGTLTLLATPSGRESQARAINARGQIVGYTWHGTTKDYEDADQRAVLWQSGRRVALPSLGGRESSAADVDDRGRIVGWSEGRDGKRHATLWRNRIPRDLGRGFDPAAINDRGLIVGTCGERACVWMNGRRTILPSFGYTPAWAADINDDNWIVGAYTDDLGGEGQPLDTAILWRPR